MIKMTQNRVYKNHSHSNGSALIYILVAIALLGALTASLTGTSSLQSNAQRAEQLKLTLQASITQARNVIMECVTLYPDGDPTINQASTTDADYVAPYPVRPASMHLDTSTLGREADNRLSGIRCPGNPGVDNNHTPLFGAKSGNDIIPLPDVILSGEWHYNNGTQVWGGETQTGVYIRMSTSRTDPYIQRAGELLEETYNECEFDFMVGNDSNGCTTGSVCFRYWFIRQSPSCP